MEKLSSLRSVLPPASLGISLLTTPARPGPRMAHCVFSAPRDSAHGPRGQVRAWVSRWEGSQLSLSGWQRASREPGLRVWMATVSDDLTTSQESSDALDHPWVCHPDERIMGKKWTAATAAFPVGAWHHCRKIVWFRRRGDGAANLLSTHSSASWEGADHLPRAAEEPLALRTRSVPRTPSS